MNKIEAKIKYPLESAGRIMIESVPLAGPEEIISDVKRRLFERLAEFEALNYIYVVNGDKKLVGVISAKELFKEQESQKLKEVMQKELVKVHPHTDQERVAILALEHGFKSIPIVDKENRFLGVVSSDAILDILHSEHVEDILRHAGIHRGDFTPAKIIKAPAGILAKARLPWLIFGLFGGIFAAQITNFFEVPLKSHFILASFIPLIVYMADAVGTQTETLFIRGLAINPNLAIKNYLLREIKTGFLIAGVIGILTAAISYFLIAVPYFGFILGISIFFTIISAMVIAIFIPWLLTVFKKDPALGSGPFATIITDITSLIIYFSLATLLLKPI